MWLLAISGSVRSGSYNTALAHALREEAPGYCSVEVATPVDIPLYDGDREATSGIPEPVEALKERIIDADGLVLVTPEYNQGIPGVFKNTIDWLTRPPSDVARVFSARPVALCGATAGGAGTRSAQYAWLPILRTLGTRLYNERLLLLSHAGERFDEAGALVDDAMRERVAQFIDGFAAFAGYQAGS